MTSLHGAFGPAAAEPPAPAQTTPSNAVTREAAAPRDQTLTKAQITEELSLTRRTLEQMHPGYTRYTSAAVLDAMWQKAAADTLAKPTKGNLYLQLSRILAAIRCDHTKAEIPAEFEKARQSERLYLPLRYAIIGNRLFVTDPANTGIVRGAEITAIDQIPVSQMIEDVFALFPVDGDTDYIKAESIAGFGEFMGPAFEHFAPFLYAVGPTAQLQLAGADGPRFVTVERLSFPDYAAITGEQRFSNNFDESVTFKLIDDRSAYLSVDTFVNYRRPVDPDTIYRPIFDALAVSGRDTLILDLRRNGGGSTDAQIGLVQWLMPGAFQQAEAVLVENDRIDPTIRPFLSTWAKAALDPDPAWFKRRADGMFEIINPMAGKPSASIPAKDGAFTGKLIVLTSPNNASGVTHLFSVMRTQRPRTTFIGGRTGGAATGATAGIIAYLNLPHSGVKVRVPLQRTVIAKAQGLNPRGGIDPDILVEPTRASLMAGTDPALQAALDYASGVD